MLVNTINNKYLDPTTQKVYIEGVNGCMEHITVIQELIQHAKVNRKTLHVTWFDLQDAFGSVSHQVIPITMAHYNNPSQIINYITNLYSNLQGRVKTSEWVTDVFSFLKGLFHGIVNRE